MCLTQRQGISKIATQLRAPIADVLAKGIAESNVLAFADCELKLFAYRSVTALSLGRQAPSVSCSACLALGPV